MDRVNTRKESIREQKADRQSRMEKEVMDELLHYHEKSPGQQLKDMVKKAAGRYVPPRDMIFWPTGLLANALAGQIMKEQQKAGKTTVEALQAYFDRWIKAGMPIYYVDDVLCGEALLDLYKYTKDEKYKTGADKLVQYLLQAASGQADAVGSIPYRPAQGNGHIYVDGIGMMCPFLVKYGTMFGNKAAVEIALQQIKNMLDYGMDVASGLPYHGFRYENKVKYGIIGWGRAVGWLMLGMAGVIRLLHENCNSQMLELGEQAEKSVREIEAACGLLIKTIAPYQKPNGAFCWQLSAMEGPEDSSATAMLAWALQMLETVQTTAELQRKQILQAAEAYLASCEKEGKINQCSGECMGFSQYPQVYGAYPWALGPAYAVLSGKESGC